jgi:hypothetical protein
MLLSGGWGCRPSEERCSAVALLPLHRSCTVCCIPAACSAVGSAGSRTCMQLKLLCACIAPWFTAAWAAHRMFTRAAAAVASSALLRMAFVYFAACFDTAAWATYCALCLALRCARTSLFLCWVPSLARRVRCKNAPGRLGPGRSVYV